MDVVPASIVHFSQYIYRMNIFRDVKESPAKKSTRTQQLVLRMECLATDIYSRKIMYKDLLSESAFSNTRS